MKNKDIKKAVASTPKFLTIGYIMSDIVDIVALTQRK